LSAKEGRSKFTLGGIPKNLRNHKKKIQYHPNAVVQEETTGYLSNNWAIEFSTARLGSRSLLLQKQANSTKSHRVVLDTGCSLHQASTSFIAEIVK
jgi:hypothetical protein